MSWFWKWRNKPAVSNPERLLNYIVNTEADGQLSQSGIFQSSDAQLKRMIRHIVEFFKEQPGPRRLMFYCHGGLVTEAEAGAAIESRYQTFLGNRIYPVFFIWQSSFLEVLEDHLRETVHERVYEMSGVDTAVDEVIEEAAKLFPEPWNAMKHRAEQVFASQGGGWRFLLLLAKALQKERLQAEVHLVGHSAGSILLYTLLKQLLDGKAEVYPYLKIITCSLYAPTCTVDQFENAFARAIDRLLLKRFFLYTLSDELERTDPSVPFYSKSILYLISRGLEAQQGDKPIFGMEIYARTNPSLQSILAKGKGAWVLADRESRPVYFPAPSGLLELVSRAREHGDFSTDPATLNSTLCTILNCNQLLAEFQ
ncbi:alpha/beta hydrolase [Effusibacillus pohliae]|uniref:alpha/beta hydrolase n=1 Tax=Effusibacillus pohliae TaxID=232270 RepID=UPI00036DFDE0|nr:alpha/beta hydrolase [Effusibacillus pohliae]